MESTRRWTHHPESRSALLLASIVTDNRALTNVELGRTLMQSMLDAARERGFLDALLSFTLAVSRHGGFSVTSPWSTPAPTGDSSTSSAVASGRWCSSADG